MPKSLYQLCFATSHSAKATAVSLSSHREGQRIPRFPTSKAASLPGCQTHSCTPGREGLGLEDVTHGASAATPGGREFGGRNAVSNLIFIPDRQHPHHESQDSWCPPLGLHSGPNGKPTSLPRGAYSGILLFRPLSFFKEGDSTPAACWQGRKRC